MCYDQGSLKSKSVRREWNRIFASADCTAFCVLHSLALMASDQTENQSHDELRRARELSREPARPPALVPGYRLQSFVGSGAYGEVWSGVDQKTGRRVAIKFYTRRNRNDVELLAREVEKLVVLSADRYVVQLLDVGWDADPPFYVMEYLENGSLEDRLRSGHPMPVPEAVELFQEVATGMMHLHGKGILHCDLKPGNVLLDQDGKPRVADFGQSRLSTDQTSALGTLFYMAPEQADTTAIPDARWDVYGLGALLYSMITGVPPYYSKEFAQEIESADDFGQRLAKYRQTLKDAKLPTDHRSTPGVDRALADIIDRCIATDPKRRFGSIQSILLALRTRELAVARQPLMLLGIIAPILLLGIVATFGYFAFNQAISQTREAVTRKAADSNFFAAQLAARSAAEQIDEYFRVVSQLAKDEDFGERFDRVVSDPELAELRRQIADPHRNFDQDTGEDPMAEIRTRFILNPLRQTLQPALEERLFDPEKEYPPAASWFVCDRFGNQIASAFNKENRTLGNNYSFRTYFSGLSSDLNVDAPSLDAGDVQAMGSRTIVDEPHLSAVFRSQQTRQWKVAFSAPIMRNGAAVGVVALTVDLGELVDFVGGKDQYAMLVDGRQGENMGAILEHPVYKEQRRLSGSLALSEELATSIVDLDDAANADPFVDPIGKTSIGQNLGYGSPSLMQIIDVNRTVTTVSKNEGTSNRNEQDGQSELERKRVATGLFVLAVQDYDNILSDVNNLGSHLQRLALLAGFALILVAASIGYFVYRMLRDSSEKLTRSFFTTKEKTSPTQDMETLIDVRHLS